MGSKNQNKLLEIKKILSSTININRLNELVKNAYLTLSLKFKKKLNLTTDYEQYKTENIQNDRKLRD